MKKLVFTSIIFIFSFVSLFAQEPTEPAATEKSKADILFEKQVHDFGTIPYKGDGTCEFVFKNVGKDPLILSNVKSSCGCTIPEWPKEPIKKGKQGSIKVKYNTTRVGPFTKTITVFSNGVTPQIRLTIKGTVEKGPDAPPEKKPIKTMPLNEEHGPVNKIGMDK